MIKKARGESKSVKGDSEIRENPSIPSRFFPVLIPLKELPYLLPERGLLDGFDTSRSLIQCDRILKRKNIDPNCLSLEKEEFCIIFQVLMNADQNPFPNTLRELIIKRLCSLIESLISVIQKDLVKEEPLQLHPHRYAFAECVYLYVHTFRQCEIFFGTLFENCGSLKAEIASWCDTKIAMLNFLLTKIQVKLESIYSDIGNDRNELGKVVELCNGIVIACLEKQWNLKSQSHKKLKIDEIKPILHASLTHTLSTYSHTTIPGSASNSLMNLLGQKSFVKDFVVNLCIQLMETNPFQVFYILSCMVDIINESSNTGGKDIRASIYIQFIVDLAEKTPSVFFPFMQQIQGLLVSAKTLSMRRSCVDFFCICIPALSRGVSFNTDIIKFFLNRLMDKDALVRVKVLAALPDLKMEILLGVKDDILSKIATHLEDKSKKVRLQAIKTLGALIANMHFEGNKLCKSFSSELQAKAAHILYNILELSPSSEHYSEDLIEAISNFFLGKFTPSPFYLGRTGELMRDPNEKSYDIDIDFARILRALHSDSSVTLSAISELFKEKFIGSKHLQNSVWWISLAYSISPSCHRFLNKILIHLCTLYDFGSEIELIFSLFQNTSKYLVKFHELEQKMKMDSLHQVKLGEVGCNADDIQKGCLILLSIFAPVYPSLVKKSTEVLTAFFSQVLDGNSEVSKGTAVYIYKILYHIVSNSSSNSLMDPYSMQLSLFLWNNLTTIFKKGLMTIDTLELVYMFPFARSKTLKLVEELMVDKSYDGQTSMIANFVTLIGDILVMNIRALRKKLEVECPKSIAEDLPSRSNNNNNNNNNTNENKNGVAEMENYMHEVNTKTKKEELISNIVQDMAREGHLSRFLPMIQNMVIKPSTHSTIRAAAILTLGKFMTVHPQMGVDFVDTIIEIMKNEKELSSLRCNAMVVLADVVSNASFSGNSDNQLFLMLEVEDSLVRGTALSLITNLVSRNILKVEGRIASITKCLVDSDQDIRNTCEAFFNNYIGKHQSKDPVRGLFHLFTTLRPGEDRRLIISILLRKLCPGSKRQGDLAVYLIQGITEQPQADLAYALSLISPSTTSLKLIGKELVTGSSLTHVLTNNEILDFFIRHLKNVTKGKTESEAEKYIKNLEQIKSNNSSKRKGGPYKTLSSLSKDDPNSDIILRKYLQSIDNNNSNNNNNNNNNNNHHHHRNNNEFVDLDELKVLVDTQISFDGGKSTTSKKLEKKNGSQAVRMRKHQSEEIPSNTNTNTKTKLTNSKKTGDKRRREE